MGCDFYILKLLFHYHQELLLLSKSLPFCGFKYYLFFISGIFLTLICAIALTSATDESEEIILNNEGCPTDVTIDFYFPHKEYCNRYFRCFVGQPIEFICPAQTAFNSNKNVCDWIDNVDCGERTIPVEVEDKTEKEVATTTRPLFGYDDPTKAPEICAKKDSESILISHEDCSKYYQCNWGRPLVLSCPTNLYYNPKMGYCDWQVNVECNNVGVINPDWSDAEKECSKGAALVPHEYCNWFYQCGPQGPIEIPCGSGTVYDDALQTCNWPAFVNCGDKELRPPVTTTEEAEPVTEPEVTEPEAIKPEVTTEPEVIKPETALPEETTVDDVLVTKPIAES